jgi:hypothetical protein
MSGWGDDVGEMPTRRPIDDASAEALLRGAAVPHEMEPLAGFVRAIRSTAGQPVRPSHELAERMASGVFVGEVDGRTTVGRALSRLASLSLRTKVVTGLVATMTGLTGVTAAGALPDAAQARVESAIESITPIDFADPSEFGQEVVEDAQDGGVDGQEISEDAREQGIQPEGPGYQGKADEYRPVDPPDGAPAVPPTVNDTTPGAPADHPEPNDHPGVDSTGQLDNLPVDPSDPR